MFRHNNSSGGVVTSAITASLRPTKWTIFILLTITHCAQAQFKIIGLLSDAADGSSATGRASASATADVHPLDISSPLVKIDAFAAPTDEDDTDDAVNRFAASGVVGEARALVDGDKTTAVDANHHHDSNNKSTTIPSVEVVPNVRKEIIKVRIMDDEQQRPHPESKPIVSSIIDINNATSESVSAESTGIAALMDKQARLYASKCLDQYQHHFAHYTYQFNTHSIPFPIPESFKTPNIRTFAYSEKRSFHKSGHNTLATRDADVDAAKQLDELKLKKITRYRNSFKTRCRCERISNCPRIQITIHRCAQDYFMCCF